MIDTHAHLSMLARRGIDANAVLEELLGPADSQKTEGTSASPVPSSASQPPRLRGIIDISLDPGDLPGRIKAFSRFPRIRFASGLWPHAGAIERRHELVPALERDIRSAPPGMVCALGEFGLDRHREHGGDTAGERELAELQMDLARRLNLPVIIHSRDAPKETADILSRFPGVRGVVHCFSYGPEEAKLFLDAGYFISFAGNLTYKNAQNIRNACAMIPHDRIFFETDCPYLAPVPYRGKSAHPGMVEETYKLASHVRSTDLAALTETAAHNARLLFGGWF